MSAETLKKYCSVREIAELYGFTPKVVREFCNSRGQQFAFKPTGGRFYIDHRRFREYLERKRREGAKHGTL